MQTQGNTRLARNSTVLITGVSSGIGLGMAQAFLRRGHRVLGSVRSGEKGEELRQMLGENFVPLVFDVCDQKEIDRAAATLQTLLPQGRLDALINNAGYAEIGPLLHVDPQTLAQHLDTLVVGQLRVTQRFFRHLAIPGQPPGRIINISSISGVDASPFFGCYVAAKHALEGLSKTLREEVRRYGVAVIVVAPGNIATDIWGKQRADHLEPYRQTDYFTALQQRLEWIAADAMPNAMSVEEFASALYEVYADPAPADRYTIIKGRKPGILPSRRAVRVTKG
jgi:NAD(P)-dependent dehydrogenase (short-subunit alcohol dehydrogenase family)